MAKVNRVLEVHTLSSDFRQATRAVSRAVPTPKPRQVVVRNHWLAINASDINFTSGRYLPGVEPPFDAGMEGLGEVVAVGSDVKNLKAGDAVAVSGYGMFAEYKAVNASACVLVPFLEPEAIPLIISGLTASLALEQMGGLNLANIVSEQPKKLMNNGRQVVVLVTAAAGATGCFAVQLAKLAGAFVAGTCSSDEKAEYLRSIGCDRPINYKKESLFNVLKKEFPQGVDIVYESVGGQMFEDCLNNMAVRGKLIVIGMVSGYKDQTPWKGGAAEAAGGTQITMKLLRKSVTVSGFFLMDFAELFSRHLRILARLVRNGRLIAAVDKSPEASFEGLQQVPEAIDFLFSGKNKGKVVVRLVGDDGSPLTQFPSSHTAKL